MTSTLLRRLRPLAIGVGIVGLVATAGCSGPDAGASEDSAAPTTSAAAPGVPEAVISVDPPLDGSAPFAPITPVTISAGNGMLTEVVLAGPDGLPVPGVLSPDGRVWQSSGLLAYDSTYQLQALAVNTAGDISASSGAITTVTPRTFTYPSLLPNANMTSVGVGMPVVVRFDEDILDKAAVERRMVVTTTPPVAGSWNWLSDREAHFRPQDYWAPGTHVVVDVNTYGVNVGDNVYGEENRHLEFDIHDAMVAQVDDSDLVLRIFRNGVLEREMPTSLGKSGFETPSGTYLVMQQDRRYTMDSSTYGTPIDDPQGYRTEVEYASRISYSGIFVHAAPWSVGDQGRRNVSHGCLNVSTSNAGYFFDNFGWGDIVQVTGTGVALESTDGLGDWNIPWEEWVLGSALG